MKTTSYLVYTVLMLVVFIRVIAVCGLTLSLCSSSSGYRTQESADVFWNFKQSITERIFSDFPSPHAELLLGMTLGVDAFDRLPIFSEMLRNTGTIHVVVVSGYNVTLVFNLVISVIGSFYKRQNLIIALICTLLFSILSGFEPPVVRAWLMGSILVYAKYLGVKINTLLVLIFTGLVLLVIYPHYIISLSFWLSFSATLSLMLFDIPLFNTVSESAFIDDLKSTLAAQILVWPLISYFFGQVSLISPIVNMLVLWTIPISTILGSAYVMLYVLHIRFLLNPLAQLSYFLLDYFVFLVEQFSTIKFGSVPVAIPLSVMVAYYLLVFFYIYRKSK